jgi:hypothetical protein
MPILLILEAALIISDWSSVGDMSLYSSHRSVPWIKCKVFRMIVRSQSRRGMVRLALPSVRVVRSRGAVNLW